MYKINLFQSLLYVFSFENILELFIQRLQIDSHSFAKTQISTRIINKIKLKKPNKHTKFNFLSQSMFLSVADTILNNYETLNKDLSRVCKY